MADNIQVKPTPIQRNFNDVALELTQLYYQNNPLGDIEEIQETYARFYAVAAKIYYPSGRAYDNLIAEEIKNNL